MDDSDILSKAKGAVSPGNSVIWSRENREKEHRKLILTNLETKEYEKV